MFQKDSAFHQQSVIEARQRPLIPQDVPPIPEYIAHEKTAAVHVGALEEWIVELEGIPDKPHEEDADAIERVLTSMRSYLPG